MRFRFLILVITAYVVPMVASPAFGQEDPSEREAALADTIVSMGEAVNAAWSEGRIDDFLGFFADDVQYYWRTYRMSREEMEPMLRQAIVEENEPVEIFDPRVEVLGPDAAVISYQVRPVGQPDTIEGAVTIVWERRDEAWKIVRAHESPAPPENSRPN